MLLPFVARKDIERRVMINAIAPFWDGNQVWLLLGAGAVFAAWPPIYAAAFSGFYIAMFLVLATLILRPVGFEFRNKFTDPRWRAFWDYALFAAGLVPSVVFGVAFGNLLQGVPFRLDGDLRIYYEGSGLFELLNPFGLLCGLISAAMLATHGAIYLTLKTDDAVQRRARGFAKAGALTTIVLFTAAGLWVWLGIDGYAITSAVTGDGPSNPLLKTVVRRSGEWLANYRVYPWTIAVPVLGLSGPALALVLIMVNRSGLAFIASALGIFGIIGTAGVSMFPFLMPSNIAPAASLTVWDASSSRLTLFAMLVATLIFLPIVLVYTAIAFRALRGVVTAAWVQNNSTHLY
jgi:cytochrome d ubiquinol oxidase subunit II